MRAKWQITSILAFQAYSSIAHGLLSGKKIFNGVTFKCVIQLPHTEQDQAVPEVKFVSLTLISDKTDSNQSCSFIGLNSILPRLYVTYENESILHFKASV